MCLFVWEFNGAYFNNCYIIIYNLKLHEEHQNDGLGVLRVPGGWIYRFWDYVKEDYYPNSIFVPYNQEFRKVNINWGK